MIPPIVHEDTYGGHIGYPHPQWIRPNDRKYFGLDPDGRWVLMRGCLGVLSNKREWPEDVIERYMRRYRVTAIEREDVDERYGELVSRVRCKRWFARWLWRRGLFERYEWRQRVIVAGKFYYRHKLSKSQIAALAVMAKSLKKLEWY